MKLQTSMLKLHTAMRALDTVFCVFLVGWLLWAVYNEKDLFYVSMIVLGLIINVILIVYQPAKKVTDSLLSKSVRKRKRIS